MQKLYFILIGIMATACVLGCSPQKVQVSAQSNVRANFPWAADGTSDSGGGTGLAGKVLESYAFNVEKELSYQQILKPKLDKISKATQIDWVKLGHMKTWYIAPVNLQKLNHDTLGIEFFKSDIQQMARQSRSEIWIDKRIYEALDLRSQADLLLHELVMAAYFLKFLDVTELCKSELFTEDTIKKSCREDLDLLAVMRKPKPPRALDAQDNQNIRDLTSAILNETINIDDSMTVQRKFRDKQFDQIVFSIEENRSDASDIEQVELSGEKIKTVLDSAELTGAPFQKCYEVNADKWHDCSVGFSIQKSSYPIFSLENIVIEVKIGSGDKIVFETPYFFSASFYKASSAPESQEYFTSLIDARQIGNRGDKFNWGYLVVQRKYQFGQEWVTPKSIIIKTGVLLKSGKLGQRVCEYSDMKSGAIADQPFIVTTSESVASPWELAHAAVPARPVCAL